MKRSILLYSLLLFLFSCGGISPIKKAEYSQDFLSKIEGIHQLFKSGDRSSAIKRLGQMKDDTLEPAEQSKKYNLLGVIYFSDRKYNEAIKTFKRAALTSSSDSLLSAQIYLNLGSSYFKTSNYKKADEVLSSLSEKYYDEDDRVKFFKLKYLTSMQLEKNYDVVNAVYPLMNDASSLLDVENSEYREVLSSHYKLLSQTERSNVLSDVKASNDYVAAYLAKIEIERRFFEGDKDGAAQVISWVKSSFSSEEIQKYAQGFEARLKNISKLDPRSIGVILPMSGPKSKYAKKALNGIDFKLKQLKKAGFNVHFRDSRNSPYIAMNAVEELVRQHHVAVIIGGLFPGTASHEFLTTKKYGVIFISLSSVNLDKDSKNHLLVEMAGSVESQINTLFQAKNLSFLGHNSGLFYKKNNKGEAYFNEFWRSAQTNDVKIKSINSYEKNKDDYRKPVKEILGLAYERERSEERASWKKIYSKASKGYIKRIQFLPPVVDFSWVFMPSLPHEALQIIPAFRYFDVKGVSYVGGPSWLSYSLIKEQRNLGSIYLVGDDPKKISTQFKNQYTSLFKTKPRLIETLSYQALDLAVGVLQNGEYTRREELERAIVEKKSLASSFFSWKLVGNLWMKNMDLLKIENNQVLVMNQN